MTLLDTALSYHNAGLTVLPNDAALKYPVGLAAWETRKVTEGDIRKWFKNGATCVIGVRDTEGLDFDNKGNPSAAELYEVWAALVEQLAPGLVDKLLCEQTPSGGFHVVWECEVIAGNQKLATRPPTEEELKAAPKLTAVSLIETRGKGGQFQVSPSPGYTLRRGSWVDLPHITPAERQIILDCARSLTKTDRRTITIATKESGERAGDRYNGDPKAADEALALLTQAGWTIAMERGDALYLCRPGKDRSWSATFGYVAPGVLYVFSSNCEPFRELKAYSPFAVYTELQHGGDYKSAARALHQRYEGAPRTRTALNDATVQKPASVYVLAPDQPQSVLIIDRLATLGFTFRLNVCVNTVEVNGRPINEIIQAEIRVALRDAGMAKQIAAAEDAYVAEAKKNGYHPVREYLDSLVWDGEDHITRLTDCLHSSDPPIEYQSGEIIALHHVYLYRWLIGAVAKVYTGAQNPMLVWDGPQGIGKSTLAHWLCPLLGYFIEGAINVADKDSLIRLASQWIWEVAELDATTRKADQSALKDFITKEVVTVRKPYGHGDFKGPAMASLIGTLNNTSGFLADESGSRRFMITKLDRIDLRYQEIDVARLWAQAVALYRSGEKWQLYGEEAAAQAKVNEGYEVETVLTDWLDRSFTFDPTYDERYSLADIISVMDQDGVKMSGSERSQAMELSRVLLRLQCRVLHTRTGNRWMGLLKRPR